MEKRGETRVDEGETVALARQPVLAATATWIKPQMCAVAPTPLTPLHIIMESLDAFPKSPAKNLLCCCQISVPCQPSVMELFAKWS